MGLKAPLFVVPLGGKSLTNTGQVVTGQTGNKERHGVQAKEETEKGMVKTV